VLQTLKIEIKLRVRGHSLNAFKAESFNILKELANNNTGHSHIIMTGSGMRFLEMGRFLKSPITNRKLP